ncbi:hypothetical protein GCM10027566_11570 [Arachidicoccus ginsenosidivorans]
MTSVVNNEIFLKLMGAEEIHLLIELVIRYNQGAPLSAAELELLELGLQEPLCLEALDKQMDLELSALEKEDIDIESLSDAFKEEALQRFLQKLNALHKSRGLVRPANNSQTSLTSSELNDPNEQNNLDQQAGEMGSQDSNTGKKKDHKLSVHFSFAFWQKHGLSAAVIALLIGLGSFVIIQLKKNKMPSNTADTLPTYHRITPIVPGSSGAILTLSSGAKVALGNGHKNHLHIGGLSILQNKDAAKFTNVSTAGAQVLYNTLNTPRGRQFQIELPDGTKVWLNASSSLRFPTVFDKDNRTVELSGEAYFEVKHNEQHPFQVKVKDQLIEDIGTKFNVKAYSDESVTKTALVEGSVNISSGIKMIKLVPGQLAKTSHGEMSVYKADLNQILAWKSGFFAFHNANVKEIMRQLSRWYDVDIAFSGSFLNKQGETDLERFTGRIDRNLDLQELLDGLQFTKMHFKIDKNKRTIIIEN